MRVYCERPDPPQTAGRFSVKGARRKRLLGDGRLRCSTAVRYGKRPSRMNLTGRIAASHRGCVADLSYDSALTHFPNVQPDARTASRQIVEEAN